jgi:hypothetical protein
MHHYKYEPLEVVLSAYKEIKSTQLIDSINEKISVNCKKIINLFLSGKSSNEELINETKELCRTRKTETSKKLHNSIKYLNFKDICCELIEEFYLSNELHEVHYFVESEEQWDLFHACIAELGLEDVFTPVFKQDLKDLYFQKPILFILPPYWVTSTLILPPSKELHFIYPINFDFKDVEEATITSNNGQSLELINFSRDIRRDSLEIAPPEDYFRFFPRDNNTSQDSQFLHNNVEEFEYDPVNTLSIKNKNGDIKLQSNKTYLIVDKENNLRFVSFDNESEIKTIKYVVSTLDYSRATNKSLMHEQLTIMNVWKKPLRENLHNHNFCRQLELLGSERANTQNIKNWANPDSIAPRSEKDYRAVLKFAGIEDEEEIKKYFYLAYKQRGDSISIGHQRAYLAGEIVKRYMTECMDENREVVGSHLVSGVKFIVEGICL